MQLKDATLLLLLLLLSTNSITMELKSRKSFSGFLQEHQTSPNLGSPWSSLSALHLSPSPPSPTVLYRCLASVRCHGGNVNSIATSRGLVFTSSPDSSRVHVWSAPVCGDRGHILTDGGHVTAIFTHGGTLVTAHKDRRVRLWSIGTASGGRLWYKKSATIPRHNHSFLSFLKKKSSHQHRDTITTLAYYHAESLLYTGSSDRTVKAWDLSKPSATCVDSFVAHDERVNAMVVNPDDGCLFTASADGSIKVWRRAHVEDGMLMVHALISVLRYHASPVNAICLTRSCSSCRLYSGGSNGHVSMYEKQAATGGFKVTGVLRGHRLAVRCVAAEGRVVVSGAEDSTIRVWKREEEGGVHTCLAVMEGHGGAVSCVAVSVEVEEEGEGVGLLVYSGSLDGMVKVWRLKVMVEREEEEEEGGEVGFEMSPVLSPLWVEKRRRSVS